MIRRLIMAATAYGVALVLACGCGKGPLTRPASEPEPAMECRVSPATSAPREGPVRFALLDPVDLGRAPWAAQASDRIVFGHLYETLVTIDCEGELRPGVAETWTGAKGGRVWTFVLRADARFWDGAPVAARDVAACWRDALTLDTIVDSVRVVSERILEVHLKRPDGLFPRALSASVWAVTKASGDPLSLMGSGPYRVGSVDVNAYPEARRTIAVYPAFEHSGPVVRFVETPADRVRDRLDGEIDALVTSDPAVVEYAAENSRFVTAPLPWDRTYVLLSPARLRSAARGEAAGALSPELLDDMARDAVRGDARGYRGPSWWDDLPEREPSAVAEPVASGPARRVVYDASDTVARGLAERVAALSAADTSRSVEARAFALAIPGLSSGEGAAAGGLARGDFERSLRRGDQFAYVTALARDPADPWYEASALIAAVPWLSVTGRRPADGIVPLADARSRVIARKDAVEMEIGGDGSVLVVPGRTNARDTK